MTWTEEEARRHFELAAQENRPTGNWEQAQVLIAALDAERELVKRAVPYVEHHATPYGGAAKQWLQDVRERSDVKQAELFLKTVREMGMG